MRYEKANYHEAILPEHRGNPLIEALPPKRVAEEIIELFGNYPDLDEEIRRHPDPLVREEYIARIRELRQPLPIYLECFRAIERVLKNGYSSKNPLSPTTAQFLHYPVDERPDIAPHTGFFEPKGDGLTLIGESGVGKTCMLEQILNYFPNVIIHELYQGQPMEYREQVVWIKVDCPNKSSVRDLCEEILANLDLAIGLEKTKPAATIGTLVRQIEQRIKSSFLGVLVIDEMQRLVFKRTGGENNLLNFLHSLMNKLGVPIFFCANPPFNETLARTLKSARRAESAGCFTMYPLDKNSDGGWEAFIGELWEYQWTNVYNELTDELNDKIHELSVGNLDMAHRIYRDAQRIVIGTEDERITAAVLENAYSLACGLSSNTYEVKLRQGSIQLPSKNRKIKDKTSDASKLENKKKSASLGDITRAQHPEFEMKLREIQGAVDLVNRIKDPDLFQRASKENNAITYLRRHGMVCDDPIMLFTQS